MRGHGSGTANYYRIRYIGAGEFSADQSHGPVGDRSHDFVITDHVAGEITDHYPEQQARCAAALAAGVLEQVIIDDPEEVTLFGKLVASGRLGAGECSAIALAVNRGRILAIDDRRAAKQARQISRRLTILGTQDIMVSRIRESLLSVREADRIRETWASEHRFRLRVGSFRELLDDG